MTTTGASPQAPKQRAVSTLSSSVGGGLSRFDSVYLAIDLSRPEPPLM